MSKVVAQTGNGAAGLAFRQVDPDVVAAYPITPSTDVVENFSQYVSDGLVSTELVLVESEHSAMSACIGASAAGGRVMTATSSQGLILMGELLYVASGLRLPIVMAVSNRALSAPLNIHGDHSDAMAFRDSGWIQLFCENAQEVYDTVFQAVKIAEDSEVRLPVMVCYDGFSLSHTIERMVTAEDEEVKAFVGTRNQFFPLLDYSRPVTYGPVDLQDYYTEHKRQQVESMKWAEQRVIPDVGKKFQKAFGRGYEMVEAYSMSDAEVALVLMGSAVGAAKEAVDQLRQEGIKAGVLKIRSFRPFPYKIVSGCLQNLDAIGVIDRFPVSGETGPLYQDVLTSLNLLDSRILCLSYIGGLGGREISVETFRSLFEKTQKNAGEKVEFPGEYFDVRNDTIIA